MLKLTFQYQFTGDTPNYVENRYDMGHIWQKSGKI